MMSSLAQFFRGIIYGAILNIISLFFTLLKTAFEGILYLNNEITHRLTEDKKQPHDVPSTILAIEYVKDSNSTHDSPQESSVNILEEQPENNKSFPLVTENLTENQSKGAHNDSYVLVNINEENSQKRIEENLQKIIDENSPKRIEENSNVMRVNITAFFLRCCDKCNVDGLTGILSEEDITRTNANHDTKASKSMINLNPTDKSSKNLEPFQPKKDEIEVKKEDIEQRNKEDNECFVGCLCCTMKCC